MTENDQTQTSPLAEAQAESLQELFDKDPLGLTDGDIERIVTELRAQRERWESSEGKKAPRAKKTIGPKPDAKSLTLDDLGL